MASNFGIGFGGFANGFMRGMEAGKQIREAFQEGDAQDARNKAMQDAQTQRQAALDARQAALLGTTGIPAPGQDVGTPGVSQVGQVDMSQPQAAVPLDPANATAPGSSAAPAAAPAPDGPVANAAAAAQPAAQPADAPSVQDVINAGAPQGADLAPKFAAVGLPASVAPKTPMSEAEARAQAEKDVPDVMSFFNKNIPTITQTYLQQGNIEKAAAWQKYAEDQQTQKNMKTWADAYKNLQTGNYEKAGDQIMDLYGHYDDGITPVSKEVVKDKDGKVTGFNVKTKIDATGEERSQFISTDSMANLGLMALSPPQMFEATYRAQQAKDAAVAKAQAEAGKQKMIMVRQLALEGARGANQGSLEDKKNEHKLDQIDQKAKSDALNARNATQQKLDTTVNYLKQNGYDDDFIRNALPSILGINEFKKQASPEEAARMALDARMKSDPTFSRKSADEQRKIIAGDMAIVQSFGQKGAKAAAATGDNPTTTAKQPSSSGNSPASVATKGLKPYLDNNTGKVVYR